MPKILIVSSLAFLVVVLLFSVPEAKAVAFNLADQKSCQKLEGYWDSSHVCVIGNLALNSGDSLTISLGATLSVTGKFFNAGNITNSGKITNNPGGNIINTGNITNSGLFINMGSVTIQSGSVSNQAASSIINGFLITNYGAITNSIGGTILSSDNFNNFGILSNDGAIINYAASPLFTSGSINNSGGITNFGYINNTGTITDTCNGAVNNSNNGTIFGSKVHFKCTIPQPPTNLVPTVFSSSQINLSWTAPSDNGGSPLLGYKIEKSSDHGTTWSTIASDTGNTKTAYPDTGLSASTTYTYRVSAINGIGTSSSSNTASVTTFGPPAAPTGLSASPASSSQINLSWTAPLNNGGSSIMGYKIERSTDGGSTWSTIKPNTGTTGTVYFDTGLTAGKTYTYRVSAINGIGTSSPSTTASATTPTPTTLSLSAIANIPWGQKVTVGGRLTQSTGVGVANKIIYFNGTGAINLPSTVTNGTGYFTSSGVSSSSVFNGWKVQAYFVGDSNYSKSSSPIKSYNTLQHTTTLTLSLPPSVIHGTKYAVNGILIDSSAGTPLSSKTITFHASAPITIPNTLTNSTGIYIASNLVAPAAGSYNIQAKYDGESLYAPSSVTKTLKVT